MFNGSIEILDSCSLDIGIAIVTCIKSQAVEKRMEENGEKIGFVVSIIMIISYIAYFKATYRLI